MNSHPEFLQSGSLNRDQGHIESSKGGLDSSVLIRRYANGIVTCSAINGDLEQFVTETSHAARSMPASCISLFYSQNEYEPAELSKGFTTKLPSDIEWFGCSTCGEVTPWGLSEQGIVAVLFPADCFEVVSTTLEGIADLGMDTIVARVHALKEKLSENGETESLNNVFAVSLIDGLSYSEEPVTAALHRGLEDTPLVGGSAGDNLEFKKTTQLHNGKLLTGSAVLALFRTKLEFSVFTNNNFVPTNEKLVVTESDLDLRNVREFNAEPAALVFARAVGLDPDALTPNSFASHPLVVKVGGEYYCRSIQKCEDDHSLTFFCAIDNGIVLTIARPTGMVQSTSNILQELQFKLKSAEMILGFDCILRRLDAANRGVIESISTLYKEANVIGFGTYGEQYNSMHINQTFTGIAFGNQKEDKSK